MKNLFRRKNTNTISMNTLFARKRVARSMPGEAGSMEALRLASMKW